MTFPPPSLKKQQSFTFREEGSATEERRGSKAFPGSFHAHEWEVLGAGGGEKNPAWKDFAGSRLASFLCMIPFKLCSVSPVTLRRGGGGVAGKKK